MKNSIITMIEIIAITITMMLGFYFLVNNNYTMNCVVVDVNNDVVTIQTETGNYFEFFGDEFNNGDFVKVTFSDSDSINIYDDVIKDVKKI